MAGLIFGLSLSVASTVVLLRALEARGLLHTSDGQIAVGWLIVEDLVIVLALVLLPALAGGSMPGADHSVVTTTEVSGGVAAAPALWVTIAITLAKVAAFVTLMLVSSGPASSRGCWPAWKKLARVSCLR